MSKITALRAGKYQAKRVNLFLDGKFAFSLDSVDVSKDGLKVGLELSNDRVSAMLTSLKLSRCYDAACRYLSYRPRSEAEMRERLRRRGFLPEQIDAAIHKLKEQNLLDDMAFARFWKENRESFSPRSRRLTGRELRQKGVAQAVVDQVVAGIDENDSAYQAAISRMRRLTGLSYEDFRKKLSGYLQRRGFGYAVINQAVKRAWQEIENKE